MPVPAVATTGKIFLEVQGQRRKRRPSPTGGPEAEPSLPGSSPEEPGSPARRPGSKLTPEKGTGPRQGFAVGPKPLPVCETRSAEKKHAESQAWPGACAAVGFLVPQAESDFVREKEKRQELFPEGKCPWDEPYPPSHVPLSARSPIRRCPSGRR